MAKQQQSKGKGSKPSNRRQPRKDSREKRVNYDNTRDSKFEKDMESRAGMKDCRSNDIRWYAQTPEMIRASSSIPFSSTLGLRQPYKTVRAVPGIYTLYWSPVLGSESNAPINQASNSIYSFVVHANSRDKSYDAPDLMLNIVAGANVFAALAMGLRAYGTLRAYDQRDYYTPDALVAAMGFDPDDLRANLANMWFDLNTLIAQTRQIWIPNTMPVIERWFWMSSNIYKDGDSAKSQYYMFVPTQFYKLSETGSKYGTSLQPVPWMASMSSPTKKTWSVYLEMMQQMIDALVNSQDRGVMYGDIMKAYGESAIYAMQPITSEYTVTPTYDKEVLTQIENLAVFGLVPNVITQDPVNGTIRQQWPKITLTQYQAANMLSLHLAGTQVLNFHQLDAPTPEQVMIATRLKPAGVKVLAYTGEPDASYEICPYAYGTEIIVGTGAWFWNWTTGSPVLNLQTIPQHLAATIGMDVFNLWAAFDWSPWFYNHEKFASTEVLPNESEAVADVIINNVSGDWDNYTYIDQETLRKMHTTAVYSEFGVPYL